MPALSLSATNCAAGNVDSGETIRAAVAANFREPFVKLGERYRQLGMKQGLARDIRPPHPRSAEP